MTDLKTTIKNLARDLGAAAVGIGSRERLDGGPPSGDPGYLYRLGVVQEQEKLVALRRDKPTHSWLRRQSESGGGGS